MFTGIIQNQAVLKKKIRRGGQLRLTFRLQRPQRLRLGESVSVDGVCLSVAKSNPREFETDVMRPTLEATTLGSIKRGQYLNLEPALKLGDSLGGHFVTGHVDGCGEIGGIQRNGRNRSFKIKAPPHLLRLLAPKGSIALDGISLTLQKVRKNSFEVSLIPLTLRRTAWGRKKVGERVNLEIDLLTRYLNILSEALPRRRARLKVSSLRKQGF